MYTSMYARACLAGTINIIFGLGSTMVWFSFFWLLNGAFQGIGAPACAKLLTNWFSAKQRGTWYCCLRDTEQYEPYCIENFELLSHAGPLKSCCFDLSALVRAGGESGTCLTTQVER